jgi:hypothetical protein
VRIILGLLAGLLWTGSADAQGYQCRTSPVGASTAYCASEAFVTESVGTVGTLPPGVDTNVSNPQTGSYTICNGMACGGGTPDCKLTISWSGNPGAITLPSVLGFPATCSVKICNNNPNDASHHAVNLSGFPSPSLSHLWMGQCIAVAIVNASAWAITEFPGKFLPGFSVSCYADPGGSNNNDSLVSNASNSAVYDPNQCLNIWQNEMDLGSQQPAIKLTCGATYNQDGSAGSFLDALRPTRVIFLITNGSCSGAIPAIRNTTGNVIAELADFGGYVIIDGINLDCTLVGSHPCVGLFIHQQNGADLSTSGFTTGVVFTGSAGSDLGIWCDSVCKINTAAPISFAGTFNNLIQLDFGSMMDLNSGMILGASIGVGKNIAQIDKGSQLSWSGQLTLGASNSIAQVFEATNGGNVLLSGSFAVSGSIGGGARQWAILNNGLFCNASSTPVPGSAGINTSAAWAPGIIAAATGGVCFP